MSFPGSLQYKNKMDAERKKIQYVAASSRAVVVTKSLPASFAPSGPLLMSSMVTSTSSATQISTQMSSGVHAVTLADFQLQIKHFINISHLIFCKASLRSRYTCAARTTDVISCMHEPFMFTLIVTLFRSKF